MPRFLASRTRTSTPTRRRPVRRRLPASRLCLETLEDRCLLSFSPAVSYPTGVGPTSVVTGDFNGDGKLDLAVANSSANTVSIQLGNTDGTFQPAQTFATFSGPRSLALGDFNGDGKLDLVTSTSVHLSNGNGTFQPALPWSALLPKQFPPGYTGLPGQDPPGSTGLYQNPTSVAVGDINGDGKLDLAVTARTDWRSREPSSFYPYFTYVSHSNAYVNVLLGHGDGTFAPANSYLESGTNTAHAIAIADFNRDGKLDVVTANDTTVTLRLGNGDGTLRAPTSFATGGAVQSVAVGDINGDGKLDLVTANDNVKSVSTLLGNGDGTFQAHADVSLPGLTPLGYRGVERLPLFQNPTAVVVGDLNGDGKLDLAVTTNSPYSVYLGSSYGSKYYSTVNLGKVNVLLGNGDGTFQPALMYATGPYPYSVAVGDFNRDASPDLAVANVEDNTVSVLLNAKDWSTTPRASSLAVSGFLSATAAGQTGSFTVRAKNTDGTTATGYTGTVHSTSSDGQAGLPADYTFTAADAGVHTFSATLKTAGTQSITATDATTASLTGSEVNITVDAAAASHLDVGAPAGGTAGNAFSLMLTARDPYNNIAGGYRGTVHFTSTDGQASLPANYTFPAADAGLHAFNSGVVLKTAGSRTVTATDTAAASVAGNASVEVSSAAASTMTVAGFPSTTTAGVAGGVAVTLKDPYGNTATGYTGTVHFTSSDGQATLPANYTFTAADAGVHTFSAPLRTAGTQSITVQDAAAVALGGSEGGISVRPAAASKFLIRAPASVSSGVAFGLTGKVQDAYGNVVTGYTGTIHFRSTDNTATLPPDYTFTAADQGVHTFTRLVLRKKGTQKITLTDTLNGALTNSVNKNVL